MGLFKTPKIPAPTPLPPAPKLELNLPPAPAPLVIEAPKIEIPKFELPPLPTAPTVDLDDESNVGAPPVDPAGLANAKIEGKKAKERTNRDKLRIDRKSPGISSLLSGATGLSIPTNSY